MHDFNVHLDPAWFNAGLAEDKYNSASKLAKITGYLVEPGTWNPTERNKWCLESNSYQNQFMPFDDDTLKQIDKMKRIYSRTIRDARRQEQGQMPQQEPTEEEVEEEELF